MQIKTDIDPSDFEVGVAICRFQVHQLHAGHIRLLDYISSHHKKMIIFLGVARVLGTKNNPMDFATRRAMVQNAYPDAVIVPLQDQRSDEKWSQTLDEEVKNIFGERNRAILYGSRDSFIPHYKGHNRVAEVITDVYYSGTQVRKEVSREILQSSDFRAGVIHSTYARFPITFPTVDVVAYNEQETQLLLCKKPNENKFRFVGGFVDRKDLNYEMAARREFMEETGAEIGNLQYVASAKIEDWRYKSEEDGIMTTLYIGKYIMGRLAPADDIESLHWVDITTLIRWNEEDKLDSFVMPEHVELMQSLIQDGLKFISNQQTDNLK